MAKKKSTKSTMMGFYPNLKLKRKILETSKSKQQTISVVVCNAVAIGLPPIMEIDERHDSP